MRKILSFSINIATSSTLTAIPKRRKIVNSFDYTSLIVGVERLEDESNVEIKNRIWDASVNTKGPTHNGVINGLTREFGFLKKEAITVDVKLNSNGSLVGANPRIDFLANKVVLYSDWRNNGTEIIDKEIRIYQPEDAGFYLDDLISEINSSNCFSASLLSGIRPNTHSTSIIKNTSSRYIPNGLIRNDERTTLAFQYVVKDSVVFRDTSTFLTEVDSDPSSDGEYHIDYKEGILTSYLLPNIENNISYYANEFPLTVSISPIQVFSLNDDNFTDELFNKQTLDSGEQINSLPNNEGAQIYHQLFLESKVFWGKDDDN